MNSVQLYNYQHEMLERIVDAFKITKARNTPFLFGDSKK